jgi:hypothetical protein
MSTATAAVFLLKPSADMGVLLLTSASSWTSSLGKWLANTRHPKALAFRKWGRALDAMGSHSRSGMGDSSSG